MSRADRATHDGADRRFGFLLYFAALALYAVAFSWGTPLARGPGHDMPWGSDELGPVGALGELHRLFLEENSEFTNSQYPIFGQVIQATPIAIYLGWLRASGQLGAASSEYPFGLADPVASLATMTLLARLPSLLLGAGVAVFALLTARELWGSRAGRFAGVATLLLYTLGYYARTSNVDAPALFLTAAGIYAFARCLTRGIDQRTLLAFGGTAALASATKDASYAVFAACGLVLAGDALWARRHERGALGATVVQFLPSFAVAVAVYAIASGLVFSVERFESHVAWVMNSTAARLYPPTLLGMWNFLCEISVHVLDTLGAPLLVCSVAGIALAARSQPRHLLLIFPAVAFAALTILPVRFVNIRYVLVPCYLLVLFSGYTASALSSSRSTGRQRAAQVALALVLLWSLVRAVDLANQMRKDGRTDLARWLLENTADGDRVAYFGAFQKMPRVSRDLHFVNADALCAEADWRGESSPAFALVIPQQHFEVEHEAGMADEVFSSLRDGRLGYELVYQNDGPGWFARRPIPFVNPPLRVFARSDRVQGLSARVEAPARRPLARLEEWIGLTPGIPHGLMKNPDLPLPCES